jgi:hypothetical protein
MGKKSLEEIVGVCKEILGPHFNKIINEYQPEFEDFVVGTHHDIHNKFCELGELERDLCSITVIHYLLMNQMCRAMSNIDVEEYWEDMFEFMNRVGVGMCRDWSDVLKQFREKK